MKPTKGYYCLIQYCPDLLRLEAATIGLLLFCPETGFLKARMSGNNKRIIKFFGSEGHDWDRINLFKKGIEDRLQNEQQQGSIDTLSDLELFIAQRANLLQITPPRSIRVTAPERDLERLYEDVMGETTPKKARRDLRRLLEEKFSQPSLLKKVRRDVSVEVPGFTKPFTAPFGFQNGRFNLIKPVRFEAENPESSITYACRYAVEGHSLHENPDKKLGELQLCVVAKFRNKDTETPATVKQMFNDYNVKLFTVKEVPQLVQEIVATGKEFDDANAPS